MLATTLLPSPPLSELLFDPWKQLAKNFGTQLGRMFPGSVYYRPGQASHPFGPEQLTQLGELMEAVRPTERPGIYTGAAMSSDRTALCAKLGDKNPIHLDPENPHPNWGKLISHGMDAAATQAFAALRLDLETTHLAPAEATIKFRQPIFTDEETVTCISVAPTESPADLGRIIEVFTWNKKEKREKKVVTLTVTLCQNPFFNDRQWLESIMAPWSLSALLAETWPNCVYAEQKLHFGQPFGGDILETFVRGMGKNAKGFCIVDTQAFGTGQNSHPFAMGQAAILLPAPN